MSRDGVKLPNIKSLAKTSNPERAPLIPGVYRLLPEVHTVKDYSKIVKPLISLIAGYPPRWKGCSSSLDGG